MICKVKNTIEKHRMLENIKSVAVGVSGGADSMCLLHLLSRLKEEYGIIIKAVHLNHGIRGNEALRDENAVKEFCQKNDIELLVFHRDIPYLAKEKGLGEEECGRIIRYECFKQAQCDVIATAHTLSDSIETMLFNLLRGTGTKGLCGIPPVRKGNIIRPLIGCTREEIEAYCEENAVSYVTDSTNLTDEYKRNFIRHNIVPLFSEINENYTQNISSAMEILRCENGYIENMAEELLLKSECDGGYKAEFFRAAHQSVRKRAIAKLLNEKMSKSTERRHIDLADKLVIEGNGKIELSKDLYISLSGDIISFQRAKQRTEDWSCDLADNRFVTPYGTYSLTKGTLADIKDRNSIDEDKLSGVLTMTSRRQGDSFYSRKRKNTKSLKKLFNEDKIPEERRGKTAVLRNDDKLVWLEGYGTDGKYLPDEKTNNVLIIKKDG
ncbi:MAG: tRNA lysidine(34) synthetase TilS [Clostridia bacterium]|nr:tRNA lysidine(34) synthetase TilS [Clostridia bacterium]